MAGLEGNKHKHSHSKSEKNSKKRKHKLSVEDEEESKNHSKVEEGQEMKKKSKEKKNRKKSEIKDAESAEKNKKIEKDPKNFPTVSIAIAGSIIDNAQSHVLATKLAGQIARAATIFRINEVVVFDNEAKTETSAGGSVWDIKNESGALFLARILSYLEIPQYLRRALVPRHDDLKSVGLLPPLDAPHHARKHEWVVYREGVTLEKESITGGTFVDVGLYKPVCVQQSISPGVRVTVSMGPDKSLEESYKRQVVDHSEPTWKMGLYWGYTVRYASNFSAVFKECPYQGGYDYSIGTSEHGDVVKTGDLKIPKFRHLLIAFGGLAGLEENIEEDANFKGMNAKEIFNCYLNVRPNQGSRTIRTEEAVLICLQYFDDSISKAKDSMAIRAIT